MCGAWRRAAFAVRLTSSAYLETQKSKSASVSGELPPGPAQFGVWGLQSIQPALATSFQTI